MNVKIFKFIKMFFKILKHILFLLIILSVIKCTASHIEKEMLMDSRTKVISYFIENIDGYKDEFELLGYEAKVYRKVGDVYNWDKNRDKYNLNFNKNIGYEGRGILSIHNKRKTFSFDRGLDKIDCYLGNDFNVSILKSEFDEDSLPLYYDYGIYNIYSIRVILSVPEFEESQWNYYTVDFEKYRLLNGDDELGADLNIKKYISAQELRNILEEGKELEEKLVKLYRERNK